MQALSQVVEIDPARVEVWRHLFESVAEEMGATLERTAYSPNIKERRDHSCALFDAAGHLVAQAAHIPVHLGAMPLMMERLLSEVPWSPGCMWICNDPSHGGTHLPDFTLIAPVYSPMSPPASGSARRSGRIERDLIGFVANRAHHADVGGLAPGSLPLSTELFHEGIILPPVRLVRGGRVDSDIRNIICANSRTPIERAGDLSAQISANRIGANRLEALHRRYGSDFVSSRQQEARTYAERLVRSVLSTAVPGTYSFQDVMDSDGAGSTNLPIRTAASIQNGEVVFDFNGTAQEALGSINATEAVTRSACCYVIRCLVQEEIPMNSGTFAPVRVIAPAGTLVNASDRRAVAAGNVETSQRIVDVVLGVLAQAFPGRIPSASQGTMNNILIGGIDPYRGGPFSYYETIAGGAGAAAGQDGASAIHTHMTNTRNTPIEAVEMHYPLRVSQYALRTDSGGAGANIGGNGLIRSIQLLAPAHVTIISERRESQPYGLGGGSAGEPGANSITDSGGEKRPLPAKYSGRVSAGAVVTVETPGGGGFGEA